MTAAERLLGVLESLPCDVVEHDITVVPERVRLAVEGGEVPLVGDVGVNTERSDPFGLPVAGGRHQEERLGSLNPGAGFQISAPITDQ